MVVGGVGRGEVMDGGEGNERGGGGGYQKSERERGREVGKGRDVLVLGSSLRRSFGCRMRWDWVLARLSASTRKSESVGKPAR